MKRTKDEAEQTKAGILDAAVELFAEKGFANTSLTEIAKKAEVTRGAIYWHFKNKAEIFDALHESLFVPLTDMILSDMNEEHEQPLHQLQQLCVKSLTDLATNYRKQLVMKVLMVQCIYGEELACAKQKHDARKRESLKLFSLYIEKAIKNGTLPQGTDPEPIVMTICFFMKGVFVEFLNDTAAYNLEANAEILVRHVFEGILNCSSGPR
ncbi:MAG TPA: TetR family transcriptional regulator [Gammaproteobacteria bacterium]|mgnify:CR=1 FL=1|nr:TetR family transcriptional regulator [Gammaproteobacteria bacterium]HBF08396.1 TetR family transcriptional regulator [Gammaproteobacteria bacterium]HCK94408.1 TetR family transcriptional regulator [Gammaproteobacteria bacterium]|tara:strand:+ start:1471 stop:2100 length:630 start_codon:yes stop_codon:yes gene_type:complete